MTTITIPRALLEQALEVLSCDGGDDDPGHRCSHCDEYVDRNGSFRAAIRAELAKPKRCDLCGYQHGHQIGCANNPVDIALSRQALRAEPAKPVERVEPITLDQFRAIANRTATTYRHRSDPEKSSYAFVDGSSLDDFWRKVCEAIQPTSAWHDAPEVADLKAQRDELLTLLIYVLSEIKSEYPESQWSEYRVFEMETAIAKYAAVRTKEVEVPDDLA